MPLPITLAHKLAYEAAERTQEEGAAYLGPMGTQVTVEYRNGKPCASDYVVIAASHTARL